MNTENKTPEKKIISSEQHNGKVGFFEAIKLFYINYFDFKARASVSEYWWVFLYYAVTYAPIIGILFLFPPLGAVLYLSMIIPGVSLTFRRLHDTGLSGIWYLIAFIPIVGTIIMIKTLSCKSDGDNLWGPGPLLHNGEIVTDATVRTEAMKLIPKGTSKLDADRALSSVIPTYTGKEKLEKAVMLCNPVEVGVDIMMSDTVTLAMLLYAFDKYLSVHRFSELVELQRENVLTTLRGRLFEGKTMPKAERPKVSADSDVITHDQNRSKITNAVIEKDLKAQKHSVGEYIGQAILAALIVVLTVFGNPLILILGIFLILNVVRMIKDDIKRTGMKYYVLERACAEKDIVEDEDNGKTYPRLWFADITEERIATIVVSQEFYDATPIGEKFYIVVLLRDSNPCLCYRKSEWVK